jgi:hypothetical protein
MKTTPHLTHLTHLNLVPARLWQAELDLTHKPAKYRLAVNWTGKFSNR